MMRVAVPVKDDGLEVFRRTGRAPFFAVYEIDEENKTFKFLEIRKNPHAEREEHDHDEDDEKDIELHRKDLGVIKDCKYIIVGAVGKHLKKALELEGIGIIKLKYIDGIKADDFVKEFLANL